MSVFAAPDFDGHRQVSWFHDADTGLRAIIAVHDLTLGPALGGCRMYAYANEAAALADVLRLSRGMTYKAAIAGVRLGGAKSVIIGDPHRDKTPALMHAMGRAIEQMGGRYIAGADIGTNTADMMHLRRETRYVSCIDVADGGYGDPAPMTALGAFQSIRAAARHRWGSDALDGRTVAIQGVGNVGHALAALVARAGGRLIVSDTYQPNAERAVADFGATVIDPQAILSAEADILAPCAVGAVLNDASIPRLRAGVIAGAANNQLAEARHGEMLRGAGIVYVPDYVANGGGLVSCAAEWYGTDRTQVEPDVLRIEETVAHILADADAAGITTNVAADRLAQARLRAARDEPVPVSVPVEA